jgi:hypothetical protein
MPDFLDTSQYDLPAGPLLNAFASDDVAGARSELLGQLHDRIDKGREDQKEWSSRFDRLYEEARKDAWSEPFLIQWAAALLEKQRAALELFRPILEELQCRAADYAARPDAELLELCLTTIVLVLGWITPYQKLCGELLELAAKQRPADVVLRARPVEGEIDHTALSREFIERFPTIRAGLAE